MDPAAVLARVPPRPTRSDAVLVAALAAWGIVEQVVLHAGDGLAAAVLFVLGVSLPLAWRRQQPLTVLALVAVVVLLRGWTAPAGDQGAAPFPSLLVLTFSLGLYVRPAAASAAAGTVPALLMVSLSWLGHYGPFDASSVVILSFFVGGAWALGRLVLRAATQVERAQAESAKATRVALEEERARIARELHDVVAHTVSIVVVQAGAAEALVDKDPAAAKAHLAAVRRTGREALAEMRHLLQVLREGEATYVPQPGLSMLPDLVAEMSAAGSAVTLDVDAGLPELPAGVELTAYRVVQEALTNVRKHAPGAPTEVRLREVDDELEVSVTNGPVTRGSAGTPGAPSAGGGDGSGHGLAGMAERVRLYGGRLEAAPHGGGFAVRALIPLGVPA